jgi:hypothetical protein
MAYTSFSIEAAEDKGQDREHVDLDEQSNTHSYIRICVSMVVFVY